MRACLLKHSKNKVSFFIDRLYFSECLVKAHFEIRNYFIICVRKNSNGDIAKFFESEKKKTTINVSGKRIYLIKVKNPRNKELQFLPQICQEAG